jgi:hypothetical protein
VHLQSFVQPHGQSPIQLGPRVTETLTTAPAVPTAETAICWNHWRAEWPWEWWTTDPTCPNIFCCAANISLLDTCTLHNWCRSEIISSGNATPNSPPSNEVDLTRWRPQYDIPFMSLNIDLYQNSVQNVKYLALRIRHTSYEAFCSVGTLRRTSGFSPLDVQVLRIHRHRPQPETPPPDHVQQFCEPRRHLPTVQTVDSVLLQR